MRIERLVGIGGTVPLSADGLADVTPLVRGERGGFGGRRYDRAVRELKIDGRRIADDTPCFVIAEIGHNHQGSVEQARELFRERQGAARRGQAPEARQPAALHARAYDSPYDNENSFGPTYGAHREALEFDRDAYVTCGTRPEIGSRSSPRRSTRRARTSSPSSTCPPTRSRRATSRTRRCSRTSPGSGSRSSSRPAAATIEDVRRAYDDGRAGSTRVAILQCTAAYPAAWSRS